MAAINTIAREYADEIREGIAWLIVWKTGRSWNAQAVWLNYDFDDNGVFEPEDAESAYKILKQDPNAVIINGYYCGHLAEDMTIKELAQGIRWHYENGGNLKDSSFFTLEYKKRIDQDAGSEEMKVYKPEVTEMCSSCMRENTFEWDVNTDGYKAYCPFCGELMMLCDACLHAEDNPGKRCTNNCFRQDNECQKELMRKSARKAEDFETKIDSIVTRIRILKEHLSEIRQAYFRAKNPNLKEGAVYSYIRNNKAEEIKGQLFMDTTGMDSTVYLNLPYKLHVLKKDGTVGGVARVVYDPERLKYIKD